MDRKNPLYKHIYKTSCNTYSIDKSIQGQRVHFKTLKTLDEAITYRDKLKQNNWQPLPDTTEEIEERKIQEYYQHIRIHTGRYYGVYNRDDEYIGITKTLEEALYFRDLYLDTPKKDVPRLRDTDLVTDNPYLQDGLKYPLPDRLKIPERNTSYGTGSIIQKGPTSFHVHHGKKGDGIKSYVCACPTIEMAEYVKAEMNKVDWDMRELQRIIDDYPRYYTELLYFYQYVSKQIDRKTGEWTGKWELVPPLRYNDGKLEKIGYSNLEDALYERDFLKEHDWNYGLLVECIDDSMNPYYSMDLPVYPTRRIRNVRDRDYHEQELGEVAELIRLDFSQGEICEKLEINPVTLRNWLRRFWDTNFTEFRRLVLAGENPLEVLDKQEIVLQPDLSTALPNNWNNWVSYLRRSNRWQVRKGKETYGVYPSEELAHKISKELQKVGWDKSKLKRIQAKFGYESPIMSKRWVYRQGKKWAVRRKRKDKKFITYGCWHDKRIAVIARDMYIQYGFDLDNQEWINEVAEWVVQMQDHRPNTMFGKVTVEDIAHIESMETCIYSNNNQWRIIHNNTYYGTYPTKAKAIKAKEFLMDNNWDRELLDIMIKMGEI